MSALLQPFPMLPGRRAQVWRHQPQFRRPRHFHAEPEINLVVRGSALVGVGDHTLSVSRGQMLVFEPGQDHVLIEASSDLELFVLALSPDLAERVLGTRAVRSSRRFDLSEAEIATVSAELFGLGDVNDPIVHEQRLAGLFELANDRAPKAHVHSRRALESLRLEPDLSEAALARRLGAAPSGISRHFHDDLGVRLVEYRARLRLMRFVELVDRGEGLSRAALDADFGSYAQCHRVFRRVLGCAPSDYFRGMRERLDESTLE